MRLPGTFSFPKKDGDNLFWETILEKGPVAFILSKLRRGSTEYFECRWKETTTTSAHFSSGAPSPCNAGCLLHPSLYQKGGESQLSQNSWGHECYKEMLFWHCEVCAASHRTWALPHIFLHLGAVHSRKMKSCLGYSGALVFAKILSSRKNTFKNQEVFSVYSSLGMSGFFLGFCGSSNYTSFCVTC